MELAMWGRTRIRDRRRFRRKPTRWVGHCCLSEPGARPTSPCSIEQVSRQGATVVLYGGLDVGVGDKVLVEVERIGSTSVGFRVRGVVRHVSERDEHGGRQIGLQVSLDGPHE